MVKILSGIVLVLFLVGCNHVKYSASITLKQEETTGFRYGETHQTTGGNVQFGVVWD